MTLTETAIDIDSVITDMEAQLEALSTGELFGLWFQSLFVGLTMNALSICIMLVIYGRMIEVYLTTSIGPIPLATMTNRDWASTATLPTLRATALLVFSNIGLPPSHLLSNLTKCIIDTQFADCQYSSTVFCGNSAF